MNYGYIKKFIGKLISRNDTAKGAPSKPSIINSIDEILERINQSDMIDASMKLYSNRLVNVYLKAILANYDGCVGEAEATALRLGRDIDTINNEILGYIEACLIDIEHGAIFKDNLSDVFLTCLLGFEQKLEARKSF